MIMMNETKIRCKNFTLLKIPFIEAKIIKE